MCRKIGLMNGKIVISIQEQEENKEEYGQNMETKLTKPGKSGIFTM